jgi:DNA uptake protein ComE-like DNA-binding protein
MKLNSFFKFTKTQRIGLVVLFALSVSLQLFYFFTDFTSVEEHSVEEQAWLNFQSDIDLQKEKNPNDKYEMRPFNPNFITDFKGYKLGMSVAEIDRLLAFRKTNRYVNSAHEFQQVTQVSDSLLNAIKPYFKFPDWVTNKSASKSQSKFDAKYPKFDKRDTKVVMQDINTANQAALEKVYMIGEKLALKIISERERFGGFVSMEQLGFIWGISPEAIADLNKKFKVAAVTNVKKIKINELPIKDLQQFPYFNYTIAKNVVVYRSMHGNITKAEDLKEVKQFPVEKLKIIALYLDL